jgi:NADH:ubiquinone oxidoreductase subunit 5 (subunit L)/multisubunit Na+/H+ antiporter MnhA subunit
LIGAFLTAAYMTRCIYLTFFGEYRGGHHAHAVPHVDEAEHDPADDVELVEATPAGGVAVVALGHGDPAHDEFHGDPHESNALITGPLWVLTGFSLLIGLLNAPGIEKFTDWFEPRFAFPEVPEAKFAVGWAAISVLIALAGFGASYAYYWHNLGPQRLAERNKAAYAGKQFLVNKYYLDVLYTDVIVASIKGPIARAAYWFNQHVIDNVLNYTGRGARELGKVTYTYIDQRGVDGVVNGIAASTGEAGGAVRQIQTGRLQFYAFMLVVAVGIFALVLWIAA